MFGGKKKVADAEMGKKELNQKKKLHDKIAEKKKETGHRGLNVDPETMRQSCWIGERKKKITWRN